MNPAGACDKLEENSHHTILRPTAGDELSNQEVHNTPIEGIMTMKARIW